MRLILIIRYGRLRRVDASDHRDGELRDLFRRITVRPVRNDRIDRRASLLCSSRDHKRELVSRDFLYFRASERLRFNTEFYGHLFISVAFVAALEKVHCRNA